MNSFLPEGFTFRAAAPGDAAAAAELMNACDPERLTGERVTSALSVDGAARELFESEGWRHVRVFCRLWWLVLDGDEVAAAIRCTRRRFEMGWINMLGVRPPWRRRGLGVDAQSETGATRLYERVGMHVAFQANVFKKELS